MDPYLNITVGHYNAHTDHFKQLLDYSKDQNYKTFLMLLFLRDVAKSRRNNL